MENLKYVSPAYQEQLAALAETLAAGKRVGAVALEQTVTQPEEPIFGD